MATNDLGAVGHLDTAVIESGKRPAFEHIYDAFREYATHVTEADQRTFADPASEFRWSCPPRQMVAHRPWDLETRVDLPGRGVSLFAAICTRARLMLNENKDRIYGTWREENIPGWQIFGTESRDQQFVRMRSEALVTVQPTGVRVAHQTCAGSMRAAWHQSGDTIEEHSEGFSRVRGLRTLAANAAPAPTAEACAG